MDPASLVPEAMAIPLAPLFLQILLLLTFVAHMLLMNVMLGGTIIALVGELRGKRAPLALRKTPKELAGVLTVAVALAVNLGVAPLLFLQVIYGQFLYTSSVLIAWWWIGLTVVVILAYYGLYIYKFKYEALKGLKALLLALCVFLLLGTGFILTTNMTLMLRPEQWMAYFDRADGWLLNLTEPTLFPRYLHMVIGAMAVGGLFLALMASWRERRGTLAPDGAAARIRSGMRWFTHATLAQLVMGSVFLITLPRPIMLTFMGSNMTNTLVFVAALASVVLLLILGFRRQVWATAWTLVAVMTLMALMRAMVRTEYLAPYLDVSSLPVHPQYGPLALFLVSLIIGLALIYWMVKQALGAGNKTTQEG